MYYRAEVIDCRSDRSNGHHGVIQYSFSMTAAVVASINCSNMNLTR
jgi:hypothetical protein